MTSFWELKKIVESGSKEEKIRALETETDAKDHKMLNLIISELDDIDISDFLIDGLKNQSKNIRGYLALVLANRNDKRAIARIIELTSDESSMVRSCAVGALGYLKATQALAAIRRCLNDSNVEVKKSAIKSAIDIGDRNLLEKLDELSKEADPEIAKLVVFARNNL
jgi:HEAT repeat protein